LAQNTTYFRALTMHTGKILTQKSATMNKIITLNREQVNLLISWAAAEGWNPGLQDPDVFHDIDPEGFLGLEVAGELVAAVSVVKHNPQHSFLGLYICCPSHRGKGQGWAVWQAGMAHSIGTTIGLDGVVEQQDNYKKSGFEPAWTNHRFIGELEHQNTPPASSQCLFRQLEHSDLEQAIGYDAAIGGVRRVGYLSQWFNNTPTRKTLIAMNGSKPCGVATIRQCEEDFKIGPCLADSDEIARGLIFALSSQVNASRVIIDVPAPNTQAIDLVKSLNFKSVFETARMYKGEKPEVDHPRLFGLASLELG